MSLFFVIGWRCISIWFECGLFVMGCLVFAQGRLDGAAFYACPLWRPGVTWQCLEIDMFHAWPLRRPCVTQKRVIPVPRNP